MTLKIRPMTAEDKTAIMRILEITPEFKPAELTVAEEVLDSYLKDPQGSGYHVLIAENDASLKGYLCYGPTPLTEGTWDMYWAAVAPKEQGRGIGSALWAAAEDNIRTEEGRMILIETSSKPEYKKTRRFHHSRGYEEIGRIPDFYEPGDDRLVLQKRLHQISR